MKGIVFTEFNDMVESQFSPEILDEIIEEKNYLETEMRNALKLREFELHYQPQIHLHNLNLFGVEALIRWPHRELGMIPPDQFIKLAEERGLIYDIGLWVIDTAFQQLRDWQQESSLNIKMAINISAYQLSDTRFIGDLQAVLNRFELDPSMIELELTESVAMKDPKQSIATLSQLRDIGFELALDDFGTGYSSLSYLNVPPVQCLKLVT